MSGQTDTANVRRALRERLEALGHEVASDSHGGAALYLVGENDLARALFEFAPSAGAACDRMYQGSWGAGMPPRFAVLPASESGSPDLEMLEQIGVSALFYDVVGERVDFPSLEALLAERLGD